ncbi:MAG: hypothetical protein B7Z37_30560 [Verrucomicrobia bacterium 12-59-8]|nr:MAG: hypothetical protein B7Z37_30560 [Verrucomicrobia bacterium 12-59-8]
MVRDASASEAGRIARATPEHLNSRRLDCGTDGNFSANHSEVESDKQTMEPMEQKEGKKIWGKKISETEPVGWGLQRELFGSLSLRL